MTIVFKPSFIVSKTVGVSELSSVVSEQVKSILLSSANNIGVHLLFTNSGKSLCIKEITGDPGWNPVGIRV
jgi:hypothetical protein